VELAPGATCWAALCDAPILEKETAAEPVAETKAAKKDKEPKPEPSPFVRVDFCEKCWAEGARPQTPLTAFSFWKTSVPVPEQKKRLLVDDSVLVDVFSRMADKREPSEIRFRFVLALILMRKRLLRYEGMEEKPAGDTATGEVWRMIPRGSDQVVQVVNPHLTAEQITEVSQQLSAILAEEI
jgi:hypothetical protein